MDLAERILQGDMAAASRLMRDIDDRAPDARDVLKKLYRNTGRAHVIGVTGPPGVGKSTTIDQMVEAFRKDGKTVGVIAVDPTSPFTGGAILGDRIRMQRHAMDEGVFIRSLATRGCLGGLSRSTQDIIHVMDAMGKDIILVETVGVGQDEIDIVNTAHTSIVVLVAGMGDDIQAIKAGIIEIGDIFVINKCDRNGTGTLEQDLHMTIGRSSKKGAVWEPLIVKTEATAGRGIGELVDGVYHHKRALEHSEALRNRTKERTKAIFWGILESEVMAHFRGKFEQGGQWEGIIDDLLERRTDPYTLAEHMITAELNERPRRPC
jgi:LAO/AO transport system kinase